MGRIGGEEFESRVRNQIARHDDRTTPTPTVNVGSETQSSSVCDDESHSALCVRGVECRAVAGTLRWHSEVDFVLVFPVFPMSLTEEKKMQEFTVKAPRSAIATPGPYTGVLLLLLHAAWCSVTFALLSH